MHTSLYLGLLSPLVVVDIHHSVPVSHPRVLTMPPTGLMRPPAGPQHVGLAQSGGSSFSQNSISISSISSSPSSCSSSGHHAPRQERGHLPGQRGPAVRLQGHPARSGLRGRPPAIQVRWGGAITFYPRLPRGLHWLWGAACIAALGLAAGLTHRWWWWWWWWWW